MAYFSLITEVSFAKKKKLLYFLTLKMTVSKYSAGISILCPQKYCTEGIIKYCLGEWSLELGDWSSHPTSY